MIAYAITMSAFSTLAITLTTKREAGELKRFRGKATFSAGASGLALSAENVAVLAAWGLLALAVATRAFRWEPQAARG